ncbi:MAG: radical SAM protein [bacterium]
MENFFLINPPLSMDKRYGKLKSAGSTMPSLGLCSLAGVIRQHNVTPVIIETSPFGLSDMDIINQIQAAQPRYAGITATTLSIFSAGELAKKIKQVCKETIIIIGGPHLTATPEQTMELFKDFDIGVIGEGEETIKEIITRDTTDLKEIKGIIFRENGQLHRTESRSFIKNLNMLPFPAWDILPNFPNAYHPPSFRFKRLPAASLVTSRGCPNKCIFCDRSVFGSHCRVFSAEYILEMLHNLYNNYGIREILFEDDTFVMFKPRLITICESIIQEKLNISWSCLGRADMVSPDILKLMKRAGCWQIAFGIESGDQKILDFIKKRTHLDKMKKAIIWTKEAGIMTKGFFIMGFPTETRESIQHTIDFITTTPLDDISVNMFTPFPGSQIYQTAKEFGEFEDDWRKMNLLEITFVPHGLTKKELSQYSMLILKRFYLKPKTIIAYLKRMITNPQGIWNILKGLIGFIKVVRKEK